MRIFIIHSAMVLCLLIGTSACKPIQMYMIDRKGPPDYVQGFDDGCDSGVASSGSILQRVFSPYRRDPEKIDNSLYKTGWSEGYNYCRFAITAPKEY